MIETAENFLRRLGYYGLSENSYILIYLSADNFPLYAFKS
jgi:hypothetical protein